MTSEANEMRAGDVLLRVGGAAAVLVAAVAALGYFFREPLTNAGDWLFATAGLPGLSALVMACDPLPGLGFQPGLLLGTAAKVNILPLFFTTALSSMASSMCGWGIGHLWKDQPWLMRFLRFTGAHAAVARWGARAVALASVTPLPYGLATVAAGAIGLPFPVLVLASLARWLKIAASLAAIHAGWSLGA